MRLERTVEYNPATNCFKVSGPGIFKDYLEVAGTRENLAMPATVQKAAHAIAWRVGERRHEDFISVNFVLADGAPSVE